ncbi:hypothetical protein QYF36_007742 [Acer negundo]|nr:hypothetical protein QYF36_007742 [Acer negundo]
MLFRKMLNNICSRSLINKTHELTNAAARRKFIKRNGERATVNVDAAVDAGSGTVYGGFIDRSSRLRFGLLDLQISY